MSDHVYVVTIGDYRSDVGEYVLPEVYLEDEVALDAAGRACAAAEGKFERDEVAEDIGGEHVMMAWSNTRRTRTVWLEKLEVVRALPPRVD